MNVLKTDKKLAVLTAITDVRHRTFSALAIGRNNDDDDGNDDGDGNSNRFGGWGSKWRRQF